MNERERLMAVLRGEKPDRIPWYADLSYLYQSLSLKGELDSRYEGEEGYLTFYKDLGAGVCFYAPILWKTDYEGEVTIIEEKQGQDIVSTYQTPLGAVRQVLKYLPSTYTWAVGEHLVKDIKDLRVMAFIWEHTKHLPSHDEFCRIDRLWGGNGIAIALAPICVSPMQKMLSRWAGVETTIGLLMDETEEFKELLERIAASEDGIYTILEKSPAMLVEFAENLSSEITGRRLFEEFNMQYYKKRTDQLHKAGKHVSIHIDGTLRGCFELLQEAGFDAAEAVTPSPLGDVGVSDLRKLAGDRIVIWGGLPGALFSPLYSEDVFESHLKLVLDTFKGDPGFVLGVADQVPPDGMLSRVRKVREMVG